MDAKEIKVEKIERCPCRRQAIVQGIGERMRCGVIDIECYEKFQESEGDLTYNEQFSPPLDCPLRTSNIVVSLKAD
jgi:hypothetical protein